MSEQYRLVYEEAETKRADRRLVTALITKWTLYIKMDNSYQATFDKQSKSWSRNKQPFQLTWFLLRYRRLCLFWQCYHTTQASTIEPIMKFDLKSSYQPTGDQPTAITELVRGLKKGRDRQVLLGVTGSGKTFTIANVIQQTQLPTLVVAHNKTLAAQLYQEFRDFFSKQRGELFCVVLRLLPTRGIHPQYWHLYRERSHHQWRNWSTKIGHHNQLTNTEGCHRSCFWFLVFTT